MLVQRSSRHFVLVLASVIASPILLAGLLGAGEASASPAPSQTEAKRPAVATKSSKSKAKRAKGKLRKLAKPKPLKAASAPPLAETRFLGKDPHGPLAVVESGKVDTPADGACRSWGPKGSTWNTLDSLGQVVGTANVSALDRYDVTNCDELAMKRKSGNKGAGLYVQGKYEPVALARWTIEGGARTELEALIAARDRTLPASSQKDKELSLDKRLLAWRTPRGIGFAVVGGRGLTVLRRDRDGWSVLHRITPSKDEVAFADMFIPLAALDMNRDGKVEIVVHRRFIGAYEDFTLTPDDGRFREVVAGIHGAFA